MPNINIGTLSKIPNVDKTAMTQPGGSRSCGAYAMVGVLGAFNKFPSDKQISYTNDGPEKVNNQATFNQGMKYPDLANEIYHVTGILNMPQGVPELIASGSMFNTPAAMAKVAKDMGMDNIKVNVLSKDYKGLSASYPNEENRCVDIVGRENVIIDAPEYKAPKNDNEINVVCVFSGSSLHWLAQGSDGKFYDPGDGSVDNNWNPVSGSMGSYTFAGLWITISS